MLIYLVLALEILDLITGIKKIIISFLINNKNAIFIIIIPKIINKIYQLIGKIVLSLTTDNAQIHAERGGLKCLNKQRIYSFIEFGIACKNIFLAILSYNKGFFSTFNYPETRFELIIHKYT